MILIKQLIHKDRDVVRWTKWER